MFDVGQEKRLDRMSRRSLRIPLLVASWFLSGWPLIPPMVQEAHAAVAFKNVSALYTENDNTGTTLQVDFSTNVEGDFLIGVVSVSNAGTNPAVDFLAETGWTLMTRAFWDSATAGRSAVYYRFAPAGGISQQIFDSDATTGYVSRGFVYTGVDTSTPIDVGPVFNNNVGSAATHTPTGADTATANAMFITVFSRDGAPVAINNSTNYTERTETGDSGPGDGTLIHWQERLIVSAGTENPSAITWTTNQESCSMSFALRELQNASPGAPILYDVDSVQLCFNNVKINDDTPTFRVAATDPEGEVVDYRIEIDDDAAFGSINWTRDFTNGGSHYTSGSQFNLTCSALTGIASGTTYYVQVKAIDPTGSNTYGSYSSGIYSFTYSSTAGDLMWHQTTDEQFDTGTLSDTGTTGSGSVQIGGSTTVSLIGSWASDSDYTDGASYTPGAGSNRIVLVMITAEGNNTGSLIGVSSATLGGQTLTYINDADGVTVGLASGYHNIVWLGYLDESGIGSMSGTTLSITWSTTPNDPFGPPEVQFATYENVDQTTPIADHASNSNTAATTIQAGSVSVGDGDQLVYVTVAGQPGDHTAPSGYTEQIEMDGPANDHSNASAQRDATTSSTEDPIATWSLSTRLAIISSVLNALASSGTIISPSIDYDSFVGATDWDWVKVKQDETNGDIKYTVQYLSGTWQDTAITDQDGDVSGGYNYIDISSLTPATHNEIRIVATLTNSGGTPYLQDWTVFALGAGPTIVDLVSFEAIGHFGKVFVEWETDSEINNSGFNVYRSEHSHYGFNKLNSVLIPGLGNSTIGKEYNFWDNNVVDGVTYHYLLEDVEFEGKSTLHGPVQAHPGLDSDGDGMTNDWEKSYGLNRYNSADALLDEDSDGLTNFEEFIQGKNPIISDISQPPSEPDIPEPSEPTPEEADISTSPLEDIVKIIPSDDYSVVLELITSSFEIETKEIEGETYQVIKLPFPHGQTTEAGKPQIPVKGVLLGIPFDSAMTFNLVSYEKEILSGYNLYPVPRIQRKRNFSKKRFFKEGKIPGDITYQFVKDTNTYSRDGFYPDFIADIAPVGSLRGQDAAKLNIFPIQFNPATGQLEFYKKIRLKVDFGKEAETDQENVHKSSTPFNKLHKHLFHNYRDVKSWRHRPRRGYIRPDKFTPRSAYKISVNKEGIYRLTWQDLLYGAGLNPYVLDPRKIKIYNRGNQIPIYMEGQEDGWFDNNDYIEFYAEKIDTRFSSTNIYWLMTDGDRGRRMGTKRSFKAKGQTPTSFLSDIYHEENSMYCMDIPDKGYVDDHWFFNELLLAPCSTDFVIPLSNIADVEKGATIKVALQGISHGFSGPDHHTHIYLNGHLVDDTTWDGDTEYIRQLNVPQSYFVEGDNIIKIALPGDTGAESDLVLVDWLEVFYWRQFKAKGNALKFNNQGRGRYSYKISGFTENDIEIFDITNPKMVKRFARFSIKEESGIYSVSFSDYLVKKENRDYLVLSSSGINSPLSMVKDEPSNLRSPKNQADYIIITHEDFYDGILPLAKHRAKQDLSVKVVKVQDIYDEFNYGIFSPEAIKTFLKYAYSEWKEPAPTYVLLVGDGTYDYQDNEGLGCKNFVPTYMVHSLDFGETGCDNWFVCLDGEDDILPDMFIGRLPVYTSGQLDAIVSKIINYETAPTGDWTKKITLVADNLEDVFVTTSEGLTGYPPPEYQTKKIYLEKYASPVDCKTDIIEAINQGTVLLNYVGHSSVIRWAHESILKISDISSLTNSDKLTFIVAMTCANGYFVYPSGFNCMAEELLYSPSGGAVAILAPTGVSYPDIQELLDKYLFESIFVEDNLCIGVATTQARLSVFENSGESGENVIQTFPLFGDPALELKR